MHILQKITFNPFAGHVTERRNDKSAILAKVWILECMLIIITVKYIPQYMKSGSTADRIEFG